jgi:hypothetical protein
MKYGKACASRSNLALAASAAATTLLPVVARAEDSAFGGGAFIGYHFGEGAPVEWGFEAFGTRVLNDEESARRSDRCPI